MTSLFCFGLGYVARTLALRLKAKRWEIAGTSRKEESLQSIEDLGGRAYQFDASSALPEKALDSATHVLVSVPPDEAGDPVLRACQRELAGRTRQFAWLGYLSTTGVYGDHGGGWVDETTPPAPVTERGARRLEAENGWLRLCRDHGLPVHIFRLPGIYGPGRNQLVSIMTGTAKRIVKPGQIFSRIHVEDIAGVLEASMMRPAPGRIYNVADDHPAPPQDVLMFAAQLLGRPPPPEVPVEAAALSPMAQSFYAESKRVSNRRIKEELGYRLLYPSYREGLRALAASLPHRP